MIWPSVETEPFIKADNIIICFQTGKEDEQNQNQGNLSLHTVHSLASPVKIGSDASPSDAPLLRKLRNLHSLDLEKRLTLEPKPSTERFLDAW